MSLWDGLEEIVAVADAGSFVGAARRLGLSTSHVSRAVAGLEARLETDLFVRTTRVVRLTDEGRALVDRSRRLIAERDEALSLVHGPDELQGELRITCSVALGERFIATIVRGFMTQHPKILVSLDLTNRVIDLIGEGYDIAIRTGHNLDNRLVTRQIATRSVVTCAAPSYLASAGEPETIADLADHECLIGTSAVWHFREGHEPRSFVPQGRWRCNSGKAVADAALAGVGICQLPGFYVSDAIAAGNLKPLLQEYYDEPEPVWAVYPPLRFLLPKVKQMIVVFENILPSMLS